MSAGYKALVWVERMLYNVELRKTQERQNHDPLLDSASKSSTFESLSYAQF